MLVCWYLSICSFIVDFTINSNFIWIVNSQVCDVTWNISSFLWNDKTNVDIISRQFHLDLMGFCCLFIWNFVAFVNKNSILICCLLNFFCLVYFILEKRIANEMNNIIKLKYQLTNWFVDYCLVDCTLCYFYLFFPELNLIFNWKCLSLFFIISTSMTNELFFNG